MNESFLDFMDFTKRQLNIPEEVAQSYETNLRKTFGGDRIRVPKDNSRNQQIRNEYNGKNLKRLAIKYSLSESAVWRIVGE